MKRLIIFILALLCSVQGRAQNFEGEAREIVDSICKNSERCYGDTEEEAIASYQKLYDSVVYAIVSQAVKESVANGRFSWPGWYFQRLNHTDRRLDTAAIKTPTETARYLLQSRYHISMWGVSNGCIVPSAFRLHDSLMMEAILTKYGKDFFRRIHRKAAQLDRQGAGLTLPFIGNPAASLEVISKTFAFVKSLSSESSRSDQGCYLMFEFEKGKVKNVFICRRVFYIQQDLSLMSESFRLSSIAQQLNWTPPRFMGAHADATVIFDLDNNTMDFYRGGSFF
jgi:hypothetical protein